MQACAFAIGRKEKVLSSSFPKKTDRDADWEGIDARRTFETLCASALQGLLGERCDVHCFGAAPGAKDPTLPQKVEALVQFLEDGKPKQGIDAAKIETSGDGGLDLVARIRLSDTKAGRKGQLIFFAQCKTGTNYMRRDARYLDPTSLIEDHLSESFATSSTNIPRFFMVADRPDRARAAKLNRSGGLLLDRCRIMDCLSDAVVASSSFGEVATQIGEWISASIRHTVLWEHVSRTGT
jgi:hypothetical protein